MTGASSRKPSPEDRDSLLKCSGCRLCSVVPFSHRLCHFGWKASGVNSHFPFTVSFFSWMFLRQHIDEIILALRICQLEPREWRPRQWFLKGWLGPVLLPCHCRNWAEWHVTKLPRKSWPLIAVNSAATSLLIIAIYPGTQGIQHGPDNTGSRGWLSWAVSWPLESRYLPLASTSPSWQGENRAHLKGLLDEMISVGKD